MVSLRQAAKQLSNPKSRPTRIGQAGFDNARENIDPHIKTKVVSTREIGGLPVFVGEGLPHVDITAIDLGWSQAAAQNTWYLVSDIGISTNDMVNFTTDDNGQVTATYAGHYLSSASLTVQGPANKDIQLGFSVDGATPTVYQHIDLLAASKEAVISLSRILHLTAGQTIEIAVRTTSIGNPVLVVNHISTSIVQIGGK